MTDVRLQPPTQLETCEATRLRSGTEEPCTAEAVALALAGDTVYPVCAFHTRTMTALTLEEAMRRDLLPHPAQPPTPKWSVLRNARGKLVNIYLTGQVSPTRAGELRRAIEDIDEVLA